LIEKELGDDTYIFSARFDVEYFKPTSLIYLRVIHMVLGGFIVDFTNDIPKGEVIIIGTYHFVIEEATNKKIELVKLTVKSDFL
jgi:CBS domain containing-hemolysin-like protein